MAVKTSDHDRKAARAADALSRDNQTDSPVVRALCRQVANAFLLYANYKRAHWQAFGPHFRDLHKLFDTLASDVLETIDPLAERVRMIGQDPPAHPLEWMDVASVEAASVPASMRTAIEEADRNALIVIREMRDGVRVADEHDDPGTADVFATIVQVHEKHEWWLRDLLREGDGLRAGTDDDARA
jgi:starvation-inducible DNA-binding protein